jgi:hypothetical protein
VRRTGDCKAERAWKSGSVPHDELLEDKDGSYRICIDNSFYRLQADRLDHRFLLDKGSDRCDQTSTFPTPSLQAQQPPHSAFEQLLHKSHGGSTFYHLGLCKYWLMNIHPWTRTFFLPFFFSLHPSLSPSILPRTGAPKFIFQSASRWYARETRRSG